MLVDAFKRLAEERKDQIKRLLAIVPPHWRAGPTYWRWRRFLAQAQTWSPERIQAWQLQQLRFIIRYACERTEGYRELYRRAGVKPEDIRSLADIRFLPVTTKQLFQDNLEAFSIQLPLREYVTTGGSTGIPFGFYNTLRQRPLESAFLHTLWSRVGWKLGQRSAVLRGGFVGSEARPWKYDPYHRELHLSSYHLAGRLLGFYLEALIRHQPKVLQAYPSSLNLFCDLVRDAGRVQVASFDLILLGSENVYDWQLAKFREVFPHSRLFAWYGHAEKVIFAPWCEHRRVYHLSPFYGLTEILGENGQEIGEGGEGELVGTSFHNRATPFIRYRTLDYAIKGSPLCTACGRPFRLLERITGRSHEFIVTRAGRYLSMTSINMHDDAFDGLRQFQFLQEQPGKVVFKYVAKKRLSEGELGRIRERLLRKLGEDVELSLLAVNEIPRTQAGKYRFLDQRLPLRYGDAA